MAVEPTPVDEEPISAEPTYEPLIEAERAAQDRPGAGAGRCALRRLGAMLVREIPRPGLVGEQHRDVLIREASEL